MEVMCFPRNPNSKARRADAFFFSQDIKSKVQLSGRERDPYSEVYSPIKEFQARTYRPSSKIPFACNLLIIHALHRWPFI